MSFTSSIVRHGRISLATALAFGALTTVAQAYSLQQQQMCTGDAMRLCASEIPNVERITACMERQRDQLSEGCKAVFEVEPEAPVAPANYTVAPARPSKPSKPINLTPSLKHG